MRILVVAAHPDDEVLGAGGTLLRYKSEGNSIAWLIVTGITEDSGWSSKKVTEREVEIAKVSKFFSFDNVYDLKLPTTKLDTIPIGNIIQKISDVIIDFSPDEILVPNLGDIHTDHHVVHKGSYAPKASKAPWKQSRHKSIGS